MQFTPQMKKWADEIWDKIDCKMQKVALRSFDKIPYTTDENGIHDDRSISCIADWTNGFWGGLMWLLYIGTGNDVYRKTAENAELKMDAAFREFDMLSHDVGFMWHIMSGINYRVSGSETSRLRNLYAASLLASRYDIDGRYILAWNVKNFSRTSIIDCMMNLPLLYWASDETGRESFRKIAIAHADMTMKDHVRSDGSVNHMVDHFPENGTVKVRRESQGCAHDSAWSRGQAWALYGFALSYVHTRKKEYLETTKRLADFFIESSCDDWMPKCDFRAPKDPVIYDSTASCCAACGLIELAKALCDEEGAKYLDAAVRLLKVCDENWCNYDENVDSLVGYGTGRYPRPGFEEEDLKKIHIPIIYGDYFFIEAVLKLKENNFLAW